MKNTIQDGTKKQHWMPRVQRELDKGLVSLPISDVYRGPDAIIHNPYASTPVASDGVATTAYAVSDYQVTDDTLAVNRRATTSEHVDNIEELQQRFDLAMQRAQRQAYAIKDTIDQYVLNLPVSVSGISDIDDGNFGGTVGNPKASSNTVIDDIANTIIEQVSLNNGAMDRGMFWVVSPYEVTDMTSFLQNNGFAEADRAIRNGYVGRPFAGLDVYVSNNLTHTVDLGLATNPTDGDTITINGVTITFVATLSGGAGEVHIASTVDITRANLVAFLNGTTLPGDTAVTEATDAGAAALSASDSAKLGRLKLTATNDNTADTATLESRGTLIVSETLTDGTDTWGTVARHTIAGVKGSIQLALPSGGMEFEKKSVSLKHGKEIVTSQIYNGTIWNNYKPEVYDVVLS